MLQLYSLHKQLLHPFINGLHNTHLSYRATTVLFQVLINGVLLLGTIDLSVGFVGHQIPNNSCQIGNLQKREHRHQ